MKALIISTTVVLLMIVSAVGGYTVASANTVIHVKAGSLGNHQCDSTEWHFVITQVSDPALAPASIHVVWANGSEADVVLHGVTGQTAHYYNYSNLDSPVVDAWTSIYDGWSGEFNLSHGPCLDIPTPTPTNTEVPSATPTTTATATPTNVPTDVPTDTPTGTEVPTATDTSTPLPTDTLTPTNDPSSPTPTQTGTQPTQTPTDTPTETATPTPTQSETPTPTATQPTPTQSPTPTPTPTITPTETPRPPVPAEAQAPAPYTGTELGTIWMDGNSYKLYQGVNAVDGTLALPSAERGAALYGNTIWVHRAWNSGWLHLRLGSYVRITVDGVSTTYEVTGVRELLYGVYPESGQFYIATCMSRDGEHWTNVQLFTLSIVRIHGDRAR